MESYKGWKIFEKNGVYTVGGSDNTDFTDCTLENLVPAVDEKEMVDWCRENGIKLVFNDLRGHRNNVPEEDYLRHLSRYDFDSDATFLDYEFIVPTAYFSSSAQAKGFVDWLLENIRNRVQVVEIKASLEDQIESAAGKAGDKATSLEIDNSIIR